jgi:hypothetical protein
MIQLLLGFSLISSMQASVTDITRRISHGPRLPNSNIRDYCCALCPDRLKGIKLPRDAFICRDLQCTNVVHLAALHQYSQSFADVCLAAATTITPVVDEMEAACLVGMNTYGTCERNPFFGTVCGSTAIALRLDQSPTQCVALELPTIMQLGKSKRTRRLLFANGWPPLLDDRSRDFWAEIKRLYAAIKLV